MEEATTDSKIEASLKCLTLMCILIYLKNTLFSDAYFCTEPLSQPMYYSSKSRRMPIVFSFLNVLELLIQVVNERSRNTVLLTSTQAAI